MVRVTVRTEEDRGWVSALSVVKGPGGQVGAYRMSRLNMVSSLCVARTECGGFDNVCVHTELAHRAGRMALRRKLLELCYRNLCRIFSQTESPSSRECLRI